jgi:hypothetical protein
MSPDDDLARAHQRAWDVIAQWLAGELHPTLTQRWQDRHRRLSAGHPGPHAVLTDVITHPEMLAIARLLLDSQHSPGIHPGQISARLGFPSPAVPTLVTPASAIYPGDPAGRHTRCRRQASISVTVTKYRPRLISPRRQHQTPSAVPL